MPINQLRTLSILVIGASITAFMSGDLSLFFFSLLLGSCLPLWWINRLDAIRDHIFWKYYGLATFLVVGLLYFLKFPMKSSIFFLVLFCIIYEFYGEKRKSAPSRLIGLLSFLIVLYHARVESGLSLFLGLSIYLFSVALCLLRFHLSHLNQIQRFRGLWGPALIHFLLIGPVGLVVFWSLPRLPQQDLKAIPSLLGDRISGFSDRVQLNDIGSLKLSRKHIMDLKPLDGTLHSKYLKGNVLDNYNKGTWTNTQFSAFFPKPVNNHFYQLHRSDKKAHAYRIDLEPLHGNTIFFMDNLLDIKGSLNPLKVIGNRDRLVVERVLPIAFSYTFTAAEGPVRAENSLHMEPYLDLSTAVSFYRTLSDQVLLSGQPARTVGEKVDRLLAYFRDNFSYSLEIHNQGGGDPVKYFLTQSRTGHCELFASAMILMLRSQSIPARLVTGFYIPQPHPSGDFYHITESDAHAWVEVFWGGYWHRVDPTPPVSLSEPRFLENQLASLKRLWRTMVISWDYDSQLGLIQTLKQGFAFLGKGFLQLPKIFWFFLLLVVIAGFAFKMGQPLQRDKRRLSGLIKTIERRLARAFHPRSPGMSFRDYLLSLDLDKAYRQRAQVFLDHFYDYRFSGKTWDGQRKNQLIREGKLLLQDLPSRQELDR